MAQSGTSTPIEDTSITESAPDNNLGRSWLAAGADDWGLRSRALMRFGFPSLPPNASVTGVKLVLMVTQVPQPGSGTIEFGLHRITRAWAAGCLGNPVRDDWGDLSSNCGPSACSECATWMFSGVGEWGAPGASQGFDYRSAASAKAKLTGNILTFENQVGMRQDVQHWLEGGMNYGWILIASDESRRNTLRRFGSREDPLAAPRLTVFFAVPPPQPPVIVVGPRDTKAPSGGSATFSVVATGTAPLSYQWYRNGLAVELAKSDLLILRNLTKDRSGSYSVRVTNAGGSATSEPASLAVLDPPVIVTQPFSQMVKPGATVELVVWALGDELTYQWLQNGQPIIGATESTLVLDSFQSSAAGTYVARVTNPVAIAQSQPVVLTLVLAPVIERMRYEGGEVRFEFKLQAGVPCAVEYADSLPGLNWRRLIRVSSPQSPMVFPVHDQPAGTRRYYRVFAE